MSVTEFLEPTRDPQELSFHLPFEVEVFPDSDRAWNLIQQLDFAQLSPAPNFERLLQPEEEKALQELYPGQKLGEVLKQVAEEILVHPQLRMKDWIHVSGNKPYQLNLVEMLYHWQHRLRLGQSANPDGLENQSALSRSMMQDIFTATAEFRDYSINEAISFMSVNKRFKAQLPESVINNIPPELSKFDVFNTALNTGKALRLGRIAKESGYALSISQADQEYLQLIQS